jgi:cystathionine beta-lyase
MIQPPVYFPFFDAIKKNDRTLVENKLVLKNGRLEIDFEDFEKQIKNGVKMFILSNPHNPGGNVWRKDELRKMGEICLENNVVILADEIHSDIVFPGNRYIPMASISPEIAENTLTFIAPSKTFNIAGLATSIGIISNKKLRDRFNHMMDRIHIANGNLFGTVALEAAYTYGEEWLDQLIQYLKGNLEFLTQNIEENIPPIKVIQPEGTYLAWLDCRDLPLQDDQVHQFMIENAGIAFNDGASFGENGKGFQRLNFGCPKATLERALEKMKNAVDYL